MAHIVKKSTRRFPKLVLAHFTGRILVGAIISTPLILSYWIIKWAVQSADGLFAPIIKYIPFEGNETQGIGFAAVVVLMYLTGLLTIHTLGQKMVQVLREVPSKIPVIGPVYEFCKKMVDMMHGGNDLTPEKLYKVLVFIDKDDKRMHGLFMSEDIQDEEVFVNFYYPTSPTPNSGFVWSIKKKNPNLRVVVLQNGDPLQVPKLMAYTISCGVMPVGKTKTIPLAHVQKESPL